jgi:hypothetical protein
MMMEEERVRTKRTYVGWMIAKRQALSSELIDLLPYRDRNCGYGDVGTRSIIVSSGGQFNLTGGPLTPSPRFV